VLSFHCFDPSPPRSSHFSPHFAFLACCFRRSLRSGSEPIAEHFFFCFFWSRRYHAPCFLRFRPSLSSPRVERPFAMFFSDWFQVFFHESDLVVTPLLSFVPVCFVKLSNRSLLSEFTPVAIARHCGIRVVFFFLGGVFFVGVLSFQEGAIVLARIPSTPVFGSLCLRLFFSLSRFHNFALKVFRLQQPLPSPPPPQPTLTYFQVRDPGNMC